MQFVCLDAGGTLAPTSIVEELASAGFSNIAQHQVTTHAAECLRAHLSECVDFLQDLHTINKVKVLQRVSELASLHLIISRVTSL